MNPTYTLNSHSQRNGCLLPLTNAAWSPQQPSFRRYHEENISRYKICRFSMCVIIINTRTLAPSMLYRIKGNILMEMSLKKRLKTMYLLYIGKKLVRYLDYIFLDKYYLTTNINARLTRDSISSKPWSTFHLMGVSSDIKIYVMHTLLYVLQLNLFGCKDCLL